MGNSVAASVAAGESQASTSAREVLAIVDEQVRLATAIEDTDLDPLALNITLLLHRVMREFERADVAEFSPHGLNAAQFNVLIVLHRSERPMTMQEVSRVISVRPTRLTNLVDALCDRGFVSRRVNSVDRRSFHLRITSEGQQFLAEFLPTHWIRMRGQVDGLTQPERKQLITLLGKILPSSGPRTETS